jgi:hypothetical protein
MTSPRAADGVGTSDIGVPGRRLACCVLSYARTSNNLDNLMGTLLRRPTRTVCFFCQTSISPPPPQPHSFLCPHCACWNHYDDNGNILSDDPAMHDESLNRRSFARRGAYSQPRPDTSFPCILISDLQRPHGKIASSQRSATRRSAPSANQTRGSSTASYRVISHPPMTCAPLLRVRAPNQSSKTFTICPSHRFHSRRTQIMRLVSQALQRTKLPSTRATRSFARNALPLSRRRSGRRTTWRARTRSDRG